MSRTSIRAFAPWLAIVGIALVAGAPLLSSVSAPNGFDTLFHFWRAVEAEGLLRAGVLFPRLAPDMAGGYGYPLFVFQGALSAQLAAGLHLAGFSWITALNGAYLIGLVASGLAIYGLARALWGEFGGAVAALAFLFIPYHLYVVYFRGSLSETLAWCFPPVVLWGLTRWMDGRRRGLWAGVVALAALAMAHPVSLYLFAPLFCLWAVAEALGGEKETRWPALKRAVGLLLLGAGLGAFAWGPSLLERAFVQLGRSTTAWVFSYQSNFLPLDQLLALPRNADPALLNDWPARGLGGLWLLVVPLGAWTWRGADRRFRVRFVALSLALGGFTLLSLDISRPLWDAVPLLASFQFPWRFLAPATLALALLVGAVVGRLSCSLRRRGWVLLLVGTLVVAHWGWLYPGSGGLPADASPAGMLAWERETDTVGTTASRELLPVWVEQMPGRDDPLTAALLAGRPAERLAGMPEGAVLLAEAREDGGARLRITTPQAFVARYCVFYYPGWQVRVDGVPVEVAAEATSGLLTFEVPEGTHDVEVRFVETPLRSGMDVASLLSLLALLGRICLRPPVLPPAMPACIPGKGRLGIPLSLPALAGILLLLRFVIAGSAPVPWRRSRLLDDGSLAAVGVPANVNFGGRAWLLGADVFPSVFPVDETPLLRLYWRALAPEGRDWHVGLSLVGPDGVTLPVGIQPWRWGRTPPPLDEWAPGQYAQMINTLHIAPGTPPGDYALMVSLFDRASLEPASPLGADGNPLGPAYALGQVHLDRPHEVPSLELLDVPPDATLQSSGAVGLWAMTLDRSQAAPGELVSVRWVWEALVTPVAPFSATLSLRDASGAEIRRWRVPPVATRWSSDQWQSGERWVGQPAIRLPGSLESGDYRLAVSGQASGAPLAEVPLRVVAPERLWLVPDGFTLESLDFGDRIRLAGFDLDDTSVASGDNPVLRLAWQSLAEMETAYRVFVHVVGPDGVLLTQSDGEPVGWTRPTTGWAVGEVVVEERVLAIPQNAVPGAYDVRLGWYVLGGERLILPDGRDAIVLATLCVTE